MLGSCESTWEVTAVPSRLTPRVPFAGGGHADCADDYGALRLLPAGHAQRPGRQRLLFHTRAPRTPGSFCTAAQASHSITCMLLQSAALHRPASCTATVVVSVILQLLQCMRVSSHCVRLARLLMPPLRAADKPA